MTNDKNTIDVFVRHGKIDAIVQLLAQNIGLFTHESSWEDGCHKYSCGSVGIIFTEKVDDIYLGVWLHGAEQWDSHIAFAHFLSNALHCAVRCEPGVGYADISPYSDVFVEVDNGQERLVNWC
jgi:hypothetical protein